jgi:hypothetical protein
MSDVCAEWIVKMWSEFSEKNRAIIKRDLEQAFCDDDRHRAEGDTFKPLGDDCDRRAWEKVRALWAKPGKVVE